MQQSRAYSNPAATTRIVEKVMPLRHTSMA